MNRKIGLYLLIIGIFVPLIARNSCGSKSFFSPRQTTTDSTLELALTNYNFYHNFTSLDCRPTVNFYATPFFKKSRNGKHLAEYFLPHNKECISIREDGLGDVGSLYLELIGPVGTNFSSNIRLHPRREAVGAHFVTYFNVDHCCEGLWFSIAFAAMRVKHNICIQEFKRNTKGVIPGIQTAIEALNNPLWKFGKFSPRRLKKTGVDDIEFKFGKDWFDCDYNHIGVYMVATAPTGHREKAHFVFEPIVGTKHGSIGVGVNADMMIWQECNNVLNFMFDVKYRFVVSGHGKRSFDLIQNGDWSRYLPVVVEGAPFFSFPGINFFTQNVRVKPRSTVEFWTALHYAYCEWNLEVGYNLWWRERERVCLECPLRTDVGIFDLVGQCTPTPTTSSGARISESIVPPNQAPHDAMFTPITARDFNLASGANPHALSHTIYGAFSYNTCVCSLPILLGFGGSFEFARPRRNALEQWGVWGKFGISY